MFKRSFQASCILLLLVLALDAPRNARAGDAHAGDANPRIALAKRLWEQKLAATAARPIPADHYPTEEALVFLSAYDFTRDRRFADQATRQLEYSHQREKNALLITPHQVTRDYQARQIYNFYLGYRVLADARFLHWADDAAQAMIHTIPRASHTFAGETHTLFAAGYLDPAHPSAADAANYAIDVNQNAEIALAFTLLYHDPASHFFLDPLANQIAHEELLASMSIQDRKTGEIPLTEYLLDQPDTLYGSYAAFSWVGCQVLWRDERFDQHIRAAGRWLAAKMNLSKDSQRYYPTRIDANFISYSEIAFRIPLYWYCRVDTAKLLNDLFARMPTTQPTPGDAANAPAYWCWYDLMGVPRSYYVDGKLGQM